MLVVAEEKSTFFPSSTEPKKLASIFVKKPKPIEKKEPVTDQTISTKPVQPKDDGNSKPLDEAELKAANMAFNALFATCRTTKATVPGVQLSQQAAPWPSVSHVTQDNAEVFWELRDSKIGTLPWKPESVEGTFVLDSLNNTIDDDDDDDNGNNGNDEDDGDNGDMVMMIVMMMMITLSQGLFLLPSQTH